MQKFHKQKKITTSLKTNHDDPYSKKFLLEFTEGNLIIES